MNKTAIAYGVTASALIVANLLVLALFHNVPDGRLSQLLPQTTAFVLFGAGIITVAMRGLRNDRKTTILNAVALFLIMSVFAERIAHALVESETVRDAVRRITETTNVMQAFYFTALAYAGIILADSVILLLLSTSVLRFRAPKQ